MIDLDDLDAKADTFTPDDNPRRGTPVLDRLARQHDHQPVDFTKYNRATPKMIGFVMVLLRKLDDHNPGVAATAREWWMQYAIIDEDNGRVTGSTLPFEKVSDVITRLKGHLDAPAAPATPTVDNTPNVSRSSAYAKLEVIPEGRYAIPVLDDAGNPVGDQHRYFKIKLSKRGKPYVVEGHGGGNGDLSWGEMIRFDQGLATIVQRIGQDWVAAMLLFAEKTDRCGDCGRSLTNEESRRVKIGPYCRGKAIWAGMPWYNGKDNDTTAVDDDKPVKTTTGGRTSHADCDHPRTPAARAACRASRS